MPSKSTDTTPPADDWRDATGELRAVSARVGRLAVRLAARNTWRGTRAYVRRWRADAPGHAVTLAVGVVVAALVFAVAMTRASADTTGADAAAHATALFGAVATQDAAGIGASTATPEARAGEAPAWAAGLPAGVARWAGEIEAAAQRHGVPARLVGCVMAAESAGNPDAASNSVPPSLGLMQIYPAAHPDYDTARGAREPAYNVDYGVAFLASLIKATGGDIGLALHRYNGNGYGNGYVAGIMPCAGEGA